MGRLMGDEALSEIVAAIRDQLAAADAAEEARARREAGIRRLVQSGVSARRAPRVIRDRLLEEGFTAEQVEGLGVSYAGVRQAVERPR